MQPLFHDDAYWRTVLDAVPANIFVVDGDARILDSNRAALALIGECGVHHRFCGDLLHCVHAREAAGGCGTSDFCPNCVIRNAITEACRHHSSPQRLAQMTLYRDHATHEVWFLVSGSAFTYRDRALVLLVLEDVTELVTLRRLLPMCANCHKVRDDADYWQGVDDYLRKYTALQFTHGLCPDCVRKLYPDDATDVLRDSAAT
jgi:hypothetical protein